MSATMINYYPWKEDKIIHRIRDYSIHETITGPNEYIKLSQSPQVYQALIGDNNLQNIHNLYNWITDENVFLVRLNSNPNMLNQKNVIFECYVNELDILADEPLHIAHHCFGVLED